MSSKCQFNLGVVSSLCFAIVAAGFCLPALASGAMRIIDDADFAHDFEMIAGDTITALVGTNAVKTPSVIADTADPLRTGSQHVQAPDGTPFGNIDTNVRLTAATNGLSFSIFYNDRGNTVDVAARLLSSYDGAGALTPGEFVFDILEDSPTTRRLRVIQNAGSGVVSTPSVTTIPSQDGLWHHAGFVFEGGAGSGTITFYFDGQILEAPLATPYGQTPAQLRNWHFIEDALDTGNREYYPDGDYDEAALWTRALTAQEMNMLFTRITAGPGDCNGNSIPDDCDQSGGDYDDNGLVNLDDYRFFADCMGGPHVPPDPSALECVGLCLAAFDDDADGDIDLRDFDAFNRLFEP